MCRRQPSAIARRARPVAAADSASTAHPRERCSAGHNRYLSRHFHPRRSTAFRKRPALDAELSGERAATSFFSSTAPRAAEPAEQRVSEARSAALPIPSQTQARRGRRSAGTRSGRHRRSGDARSTPASRGLDSGDTDVTSDLGPSRVPRGCRRESRGAGDTPIRARQAALFSQRDQTRRATACLGCRRNGAHEGPAWGRPAEMRQVRGGWRWDRSALSAPGPGRIRRSPFPGGGAGHHCGEDYRTAGRWSIAGAACSRLLRVTHGARFLRRSDSQ